MISDLKDKTFISYGIKSGLGESIKSVPGPYKPPHLRKKDGPNNNTLDAQCSSDHVPSKYGFTSSDSDHSDGDGSSNHIDRFRSSKVRLAALTCIQCPTRDPTIVARYRVVEPSDLSPHSIVACCHTLVPRPELTSLLSCVAAMVEPSAPSTPLWPLRCRCVVGPIAQSSCCRTHRLERPTCDPVAVARSRALGDFTGVQRSFFLKGVRIESTSVLASMLDGHSLTLSQVAGYKESSKCGSFTTLSSSLGQKLMQLHTGA
ncbi:hypothetical protein BHM03_00060004 [Ensete ventricosum]|nr:hypothetical protein BHM03_00060004 [Ensete ventricosum]